MNDLVNALEKEFNELKDNSVQLEKGKKVSASRVRKNAMNILKLCKEVRVKALEIQKSM